MAQEGEIKRYRVQMTPAACDYGDGLDDAPVLGQWIEVEARSEEEANESINGVCRSGGGYNRPDFPWVELEPVRPRQEGKEPSECSTDESMY